MSSSTRTSNNKPIDPNTHQNQNEPKVKPLVSEATIVVNSNLITWKSNADVCSFARTNATKHQNLDSRNCQECLASSLASSLAKLKAAKDQENQTATCTSSQSIPTQQVTDNKSHQDCAKPTTSTNLSSSKACATSSFNVFGSRLCTSTTQLHRTQVCSTTLSASSQKSVEPLVPNASKRGNNNCAKTSKTFAVLPYKSSTRRKQKLFGRPITPQFEISSKVNNNLSSSIGYKSTATYPLKKWPLINSKENGIPCSEVLGGTTITVTPPTPLSKESFVVPNGISNDGTFPPKTKCLISSVASTGSKSINNLGLVSRAGNELTLTQGKRAQSKIYRSQSLGNLVPNCSKKDHIELRLKGSRAIIPSPNLVDTSVITSVGVTKPRLPPNSKVSVKCQNFYRYPSVPAHSQDTFPGIITTLTTTTNSNNTNNNIANNKSLGGK